MQRFVGFRLEWGLQQILASPFGNRNFSIVAYLYNNRKKQDTGYV